MADEQAIRTVINEQFGMEVAYKEEELQRIDDRIQLAKMMLHRLRLGILAQQYGLSGFYLVEDYSKENVGVQGSWNSFESEFLNSQKEQQREEGEGKVAREEEMEEGVPQQESTPDLCEGAASSVVSSSLSSRVPSEVGENDSYTTADPSQPLLTPATEKKSSSLLNDLRKHSPGTCDLESGITANGGEGLTQDPQYVDHPSEHAPCSPRLPSSLSRFATKKRIIVGNTSQYLNPSARSTIDGSTHKWMVYVRGPSEESNIASFVKAVRFFLHPSYHPNDIIRISKPPFHLTRYGWGEFPVRVQLEFTDRCNKHVDIIHNLVLDRTHTGHQTLGSETVVDLDLITADSLMLTEGADLSNAKGLNNNTIHPFRSLNNVRQRNTVKSEAASSSKCTTVELPHIRHIFLPASTSVDQVHLDHNYAQIVVVSQRPKPPTEISMDTCEVSSSGQPGSDVETTSLDDFLHSMVKTVPLCGPESNGFHLVAPSIEHFRMWNIGRRRATEWMRALAMKRLIQTLDPPIHAATSLTTKQVMDWCRRNGYTPLDPATSPGQGFCKYCGCQLTPSRGDEAGTSEQNSHAWCSDMMELPLEQDGGERTSRVEGDTSSEEESDDEEEEREARQATPARITKKFSTLSRPFKLFESLTAKAKKLRVLQDRQEREQMVDILSVPSQQRQVSEPVPKFRVPQTPELKWVQRTAAAIGISIYPAVIDRMYAHVVEHMIYMACTKFARVIMDRAVNESAKEVKTDLNEERCLVPLHIYRAVESLESCDFLTNAYMGLPSPTAAPPSSEDRGQTPREE